MQYSFLPALSFFIGVQTTHGKETKSSHKQMFGPVEITSGELLQHKCKCAGRNFKT